MLKVGIVLFLFGLAAFWRIQHAKKLATFVNKEKIAELVRVSLESGEFISRVELLSPEKNLLHARVEYALLPESQHLVEKLLQEYKPDYGAFVAMDATTGQVLTLASYSRVQPLLKKNLALKASFPAASVFKVVTAAAAIDDRKMSPNTIISFNGRSHTLYRRNVVDNRQNRWTRHMTLREAFGSSINTVFAKLGLFYLTPALLKNYAERFNFNRPLRADVPTERSLASIPTESTWAMAEAASGFTQDSKMSPLEGALIASAVANDGVMMEPYIVNRLVDEASPAGALYQAHPQILSVALSPESAASLRELMRQTVTGGTSRRSFRQVRSLRHFEDLELGGKTGHLTGSDPKGRCDWFVGYARYQKHRIAVAALTINQEKWRVKSSYLAARYFEDYLKRLEDE